MKYSRLTLAALTAGSAIALASCSILNPESASSPDEDIAVTSSEVPPFQAERTDGVEVTDDLAAPVKDEGLKVEWTLQGVYADDNQGTVVTILVKNLNDVPLPVDAFGNPTLKIGSGSNQTDVKQLPYDAEINTNIVAPGLDQPLGAGASTNLQYRFDTSPSNLWNSRLKIGNVTWVGNLNL